MTRWIPDVKDKLGQIIAPLVLAVQSERVIKDAGGVLKRYTMLGDIGINARKAVDRKIGEKYPLRYLLSGRKISVPMSKS